jgi:hypothetical protein
VLANSARSLNCLAVNGDWSSKVISTSVIGGIIAVSATSLADVSFCP